MGTIIWILATVVAICLGKLLMPDTQTTNTVLILVLIVGGVLAIFGVGEKSNLNGDKDKDKTKPRP